MLKGFHQEQARVADGRHVTELRLMKHHPHVGMAAAVAHRVGLARCKAAPSPAASAQRHWPQDAPFH